MKSQRTSYSKSRLRKTTHAGFLDRHLWQVQPVRDVLMGVGVLALFWLGQKISVVTVPLLLAIMLAYLFEPLIQYLISRAKMSRPGAAGLVIVSLVVLVFVPTIAGITFGVGQAVQFAGKTAENIRFVQASVATTEAEREAFLKRHWRERYRQTVAQEFAEDGEAAVGDSPGDTGDDAAPAAGAAADPAGASASPDAVDEAGPDGEAASDPAGNEAVPIPGPQGDQTRVPPRLSNEERVELVVEHRLSPPWQWIRDRVRDNDRSGSSVAAIVDALSAWLGNNTEQIAKATAGAGLEFVRGALGVLGTAVGLGFTAFLTMFFFFFVSTGWVKLKVFSAGLLPAKHRDKTIDLLGKFDRVISGFVRGRLTIAFIQAVVFSIAYWAIGVPAAFILGPVVAILSIVPYAALVGLPVSIGLLWLEGHEGTRGAWWWILGAPTAVYFVGQALDDYVWTPMIQGKETGMDTPTILFASLAGGALFGVFGLLIAIPLAACAKILIQEIVWPRFKAWADGRRADALPID